MDVNNLTNVYNQNPTLQGSYTLQQYLDLFGGSSTTPPPSTIEPTDPNAPTTPLNPGQGIINSNINQFQNQGGGDGDNGAPPTMASPRSTYEKTYAPNLNFAEFTSGVKGTPSFTQEYKEPKNPIEELMKLYKTYSPIGFIGKKIKKSKTDKIAREKTAAAKAKAEREAKDKIARIEAAKIEQAKQQAANTRNISTATQAFDNTRGQSSSDRGEAASGMGGGSQQATSAGSSNTNRNDGGWGWADGGVVSLKNGGSTNGSGEAALSAKVKELMEDGYEFGEAVKEAMKQGYMNGGRIKSYFKGGLVSLRGR